MKHLELTSTIDEYNDNLSGFSIPTVALVEDENQVYFPTVYTLKYHAQQPIDDIPYMCGAYADGKSLYLMINFENWSDNAPSKHVDRGVFVFTKNKPNHIETRFKGRIGNEGDNYYLIYAGKDFNGYHKAISTPKTADYEDVYYENVILNGGDEKAWESIGIDASTPLLRDIHDTRLYPSSQLITYQGYTYFGAYNWGFGDYSTNQKGRRAYICRTADFHIFETCLLMDCSTCGSIVDNKSNVKQITEPDIVINSNGECFFVIRASGWNSCIDTSNENTGYYYGEIDNIVAFFEANNMNYMWSEEYDSITHDFTPITAMTEEEREEFKIHMRMCHFVNTSTVSKGGSQQGVLPRILFNHKKNRPMVVFYTRSDSKNQKDNNQLYLHANPRIKGDKQFVKIGKSHPNNKTASPQGGNMGLSLWGDDLFIACPHDRTYEVSIFIIPLDCVDNNAKGMYNLPNLEDGIVKSIQF